jgi:hypothetical protein
MAEENERRVREFYAATSPGHRIGEIGVRVCRRRHGAVNHATGDRVRELPVKI